MRRESRSVSWDCHMGDSRFEEIGKQFADGVSRDPDYRGLGCCDLEWIEVC